MKKIFFVLIFILLLCGCAVNNDNSGNEHNGSLPNEKDEENINDEENNKTESNIKVIYFSCTNNTEKVANKIANYLNCPIIEIIPLVPYTDDDLNYNNNSSRANQEQNDANARPEIENVIDLDDTNIIFLGYPIWWGKLPKIIYTFLETYNLDNYTIIPFCTSGSSGISTSLSEIRQLEPNANVLEGKRFSANASDNDIKSFIDSLNIKGE